MTFPDLTVTKSTVPKTKRMPKPGASFNLSSDSPLLQPAQMGNSSFTAPNPIPHFTQIPQDQAQAMIKAHPQGSPHWIAGMKSEMNRTIGKGMGNLVNNVAASSAQGNRTPAPQTSSPAANLHPVQFKAAHIPKHKGNSPGFLLQPPTVGGAHAAPGKHAAPSPGIPTANVGSNAPKPFAKPASAGYNGPGIAGNLPNNGPAIPKATVGNKGGVVKASGAQPNKKKQQPKSKLKTAAHIYDKVSHALSGGKHYTQHIKDMETTK